MNASMDHINELDLEAGDSTEDVSLSICRIKNRKLKVATKVKLVNQRKLKSVNCLCRLKYYNRASLLSTTTSKDEDFISSIPCHAIFVFLDTILLGVMQIEYQNKKESLLDTHKLHMQTFLTAICIYCALLGIKIYTKTRGGYRAQILSHGILLSGTLSSASLLSILLQRQLLVVVLFIWGSIPLTLARHLLKSFVCQIIEMVAKLTWDVLDCMFAIVVLIFNNNKDSAIRSSSNTTNPNDQVEGIPSACV